MREYEEMKERYAEEFRQALVENNIDGIKNLLIVCHELFTHKIFQSDYPVHYALRNFDIDIDLLRALVGDDKGKVNIELLEEILKQKANNNENIFDLLSLDKNKHLIEDFLLYIVKKKGFFAEDQIAREEYLLHYALRNIKPSVILLEKLVNKKSVNFANADGDTALHIACRNPSKHIIEYLKSHGVNLDARNNANNTAYQELESLMKTHQTPDLRENVQNINKNFSSLTKKSHKVLAVCVMLACALGAGFIAFVGANANTINLKLDLPIAAQYIFDAIILAASSGLGALSGTKFSLGIFDKVKYRLNSSQSGEKNQEDFYEDVARIRTISGKEISTKLIIGIGTSCLGTLGFIAGTLSTVNFKNTLPVYLQRTFDAITILALVSGAAVAGASAGLKSLIEFINKREKKQADELREVVVDNDVSMSNDSGRFVENEIKSELNGINSSQEAIGISRMSSQVSMKMPKVPSQEKVRNLLDLVKPKVESLRSI